MGQKQASLETGAVYAEGPFFRGSTVSLFSQSRLTSTVGAFQSKPVVTDTHPVSTHFIVVIRTRWITRCIRKEEMSHMTYWVDGNESHDHHMTH